MGECTRYRPCPAPEDGRSNMSIDRRAAEQTGASSEKCAQGDRGRMHVRIKAWVTKGFQRVESAPEEHFTIAHYYRPCA